MSYCHVSQLIAHSFMRTQTKTKRKNKSWVTKEKKTIPFSFLSSGSFFGSSEIKRPLKVLPPVAPLMCWTSTSRAMYALDATARSKADGI